MYRNAILFFAFLCGLGSALFVDTPFGRAAMFDLTCYVLAPFFFVSEYKRYTKAERRILMLSALWLVGAIWSNWWREEPFLVALKGNAIVFNVWCMLVVGIWLIKKDYRAWMWFMVGNGISNVVSLYYFQNGALLSFAESSGYLGVGGMQEYLINKQVYPIYFRFILKSVLFPLVVLFGLPWLPVVIILMVAAFFLLLNGGSRSNFGINLLSDTFIVGYAYFRRLTRFVLDNFVLALGISFVVALFIFSIYKNMALSGALGEQEFEKYEREMVLSDSGMLGSRDDIIRAWPFLKNHPIVGAGSSAIDRWGYMGYMEDSFKLPGHSALVGAWVQNGILGLIFWGYALFLIASFIQHRVLRFRDYAPFIVIVAAYMIWNILFSQFGLYRGEVSCLLALCVVSKDANWLASVETQLRGGEACLPPKILWRSEKIEDDATVAIYCRCELQLRILFGRNDSVSSLPSR